MERGASRGLPLRKNVRKEVIMDKFEMKTNKKLLAAFAVLAVAFVALAAIPAVDADGANSTEITDFNGFTDALTNGGDYVLKNDISGSIDGAKTVSTSVSFDLNGKTIVLTGGQTITASGCTLEFKSTGKVGILKYNGFSITTQAALSADTSGILTLDNIKFETDGSAVFPYGDASKATIKNSEIVAGAYAVATNNAETGTNKLSIEIENSTLTTNGEVKDNATVMINAQGVTLSIMNSTLTGDRQTLFVRAGTATVENTQINFNNAFTGTINAAEGKWGSGNEVASAAVVVGDKGCDNAYAGTAILTIKGGEIKATSGTAVVTSTDVNTKCVLVIGDKTATNVSIGSNSVSITGLKAVEAGFSISEGSVVITGSMTATDANSKIAQAEGDVVLKDLTITTGTLTIDKDVGVQGNLTVDSGATLTVAQGATLTVDNNATLKTNSNLTVDKGATLVNNGTASKINYATGSKVVVDGNEYTVYHYTSGNIDIQYGISCGDVFYTGAVIDEYDVSVLSISLDDKFEMTNKTFTLVSEMGGNNGWNEIRDARTYADALKIQLTFVKSGESGTASNITVNLKTDLVVKPMPVDIRFSFPEKVGNITVSEFQDVKDAQDTGNGGLLHYYNGKVGYYNLNGMNGYYFVITAEVYDKKGNLMPNAQISSDGMESKGNGIYMLFLGKTPEEVSQNVDKIIGFTADCGQNYVASKSEINIGGVWPVEVMTIGTLISQDVLGVNTNELYENLEFEAKEDPTQYKVTGMLLWKAGFKGFSSDFNETRGWYIGFQMYGRQMGDYFWQNSSADIEILKLKENVELDGKFLFRIIDINKDPVITLKDPNGFKTKYVLDISGIKFESVTGYGENTADAEDAMRAFGVDPAKLTENGSDVADKTMFMIFNTSAYHGKKITATATNTTDGKNTFYREEFKIENQNICIWYFSFNHQFQDGKPGVYKLKAEVGDRVIAQETESFKGAYVFESGYYADATDAYNAIHKFREDIPSTDVAANTFYMIVGIYGYDEGTPFHAKMVRVGTDVDILTGAEESNMIVLPHADGEAHKWAFYFSFDNATQVAAPNPIYGKYVMSILENNEKSVAEEKIHVGTSSSMTFKLDNTAYGKDMSLIQNDTQVIISGELYYQYFYKTEVGWVDIPAQTYPHATLIMEEPDGTVEDRFAVTHTTAALLTFDKNQKMVYKFTIDFDGDGDVYTPTTYSVSFDGTFEGQTYGIYLSDPFYGSGLVQFKNQIKVGQSFVIPNGPDGSKDFVGWKAENGKIYSGLSFVIVTEDMDGVGGEKDGKAVFTAVYKGSQQRDTFTLDGTKVSEDGKTLIIKTSSPQTDGYRNLSASFYYVVTMQNADGAVVMDKKIASPYIKNGGTTVEDVYSETFNVALTEKFGPGCIITVNFKTDFAMGQLQIVEPVVIVPEVVSPGGFEKNATDAFNAINNALAAAGRENGVPEDDVDSNTAYIVFETTEEMNGKELWGSLYVIDEKDGRLPRYYERMTFESAGPHVWYFSFNVDAPSHHPKNDKENPMTVNGPVPGKYVLEITLNDRPYTLVAEYTFTID